MKKRILALCMALTVCFTTITTDISVYANEISTVTDSGETTEVEEDLIATEIEDAEESEEVIEANEVDTEEDGKVVEEDETEETTEVEENPGITEGESEEIVEEYSSVTEDSSETVEEDETEETTEVEEYSSVTEEESEEKSEELLNYLTVGSPYVEIPGTQKILVGFGDEDISIKSASVVVQNIDTLEEQSTEATEILEDGILFEISYEDSSTVGTYQVKSLHVETENGTYDLDMEEIGIEALYGVNQAVETEPDAYVVDEDEEEDTDIDYDIVSIDENGSYTTENTLEDVLESVQTESDLENVKGNLVVCLDPGHGGSDGGATGNGLVEKELTLKIAQYAKEELETYTGVTVYMTRTDDTYVSLADRVAYAQSVGANVFISIHINSSTSSTASGAEVYYPNSNYNATVGTIGHDLAEKILEKLVALGLSNRGVKIRNSESGDTYDDGSLCDYYAVIRAAKKAGIPGLIVEHAFLSNASDASNFLSSDEKLKALGVADATAIAEYYGLSKKSTTPTISYTQSIKDGSLKVKWTSVDGAASYQLYRSTSSDSGYKKIATTSSTKYTDTTVKVGTKYYYKVCAVQSDGSVSELSEAVSGRALAKATITYVKSKSSKKLEIVWEKVSGASGYYVYRKNDSTGQYEQVAKISSGSTLSYVDSVEKNNTEYKYMVKAYSVSGGVEGTGKGSDGKSGKSVAKPSISNIVGINRYALEISWSKVSGAKGYIIARSTSEDGTYEKIATISDGSVVSYEDTTVSPGKIYYYKIQAYNKIDGIKGYSGYSSVVSGKTINKTQITKVSSKNATTLKVAWKKISGAYGYRIKRSTSENGSYKVIATVNSANTTTYEDQNVSTGKKYYYKIETLIKYNGVLGTSGNSGAVYGKTVAKSSINYVVSKNSTMLEISWEKVSGASGYQVKRCTTKDGSFETIATINSGSTTVYNDTTVTAGKTYYYKIQCINTVNGTNGYSGNSKAISGKTLKKVTITEIKGNTSTSMTIKWKKLDDVSGYKIYRSTSQNGTYEKIGTVKGKSNVTYVDETVEAGKTYYYKIRAYKNHSQKTEVGSYSSVQKAWSVKRVVISKISTADSSKVVLNWTKVANASGYSVYRKLKSDSSFSKIGVINSGSTVTYTDATVEAGKIYYYRVCANSNIVGDVVGRGTYSATWEVPVLEKNKISSTEVLADNQIEITWSKVSNAQGYQIAYSTSKNGTYTSLKKTSATSYTHQNLESGKTYYYKVRSYVTLADGNKVYSAWSSVKSQVMGYEIMGSSDLTVSEMVTYYNARYTYPSSVYSSKGASTAKKFFTILKEEAEAEGVKTEVLFAQVILETGGLQFGGDVKAEQCNFGGLGATGGGVSGETFANVRTGLRAQVQHLKAYASTESLNNECVDTRFSYVTRGTAPYVEWLSIPNNPYGKGWASDSAYGTKLLNIINSL